MDESGIPAITGVHLKKNENEIVSPGIQMRQRDVACEDIKEQLLKQLQINRKLIDYAF